MSVVVVKPVFSEAATNLIQQLDTKDKFHYET